MNLMRAVVHRRYGPPEVLHLEDVERPTPTDDQVLVAVHATTVNRTDCGFRKPEPFFVRLFGGLLRPKQPILGTEFAGEVEAVGATVTEFVAGDCVFGVNADVFGAHAEYVCVRQDAAIATMPAGVTFDEAAAVCDGAILALTYLRRVDLRAGSRIVVYGASGSIGTAAVQLARYFGAEVTAVCSTKNLDLVQLARRRHRHRLHPGRLHDERPDVRRRVRRGRQAVIRSVPRLPGPGRCVHVDGPRSAVAEPSARPVDLTLRPPEGAVPAAQVHEAGRALHQGTHGVGASTAQ